MLWPAGVVADFVDNFNTGIMVRSGTEGLHLSVHESCRFAFDVEFIRVHIEFVCGLLHWDLSTAAILRQTASVR